MANSASGCHIRDSSGTWSIAVDKTRFMASLFLLFALGTYRHGMASVSSHRYSGYGIGYPAVI